MNDQKWTYTHAFFVDMGSLHLKTPDFEPFPIDAEQLYYLIKHKFVAVPTLDDWAVNERNSIDTLSRYLNPFIPACSPA